MINDLPDNIVVDEVVVDSAKTTSIDSYADFWFYNSLSTLDFVYDTLPIIDYQREGVLYDEDFSLVPEENICYDDYSSLVSAPHVAYSLIFNSPFLCSSWLDGFSLRISLILMVRSGKYFLLHI